MKLPPDLKAEARRLFGDRPLDSFSEVLDGQMDFMLELVRLGYVMGTELRSSTPEVLIELGVWEAENDPNEGPSPVAGG